METISEKKTIEDFTLDVSTEPERASSNSDSDTTNFTITEMGSMEISLEEEEKYGLKTCLVELERCDKIWETIQLIRHLQDDPNLESCIENNENLIEEKSLLNLLEPSTNDVETNNVEINDEEINKEERNEAENDPSETTNTMLPYIKYQPVLNNGNAALPNFQFSVKRTRILYPCHICGRQYSHTRSLREHSEKVHKIRIPRVRKKNENGIDSKNIIKSEPNDAEYSNENESNPVEPTNDSNGSQNSADDDESSNNQSEVRYNCEKIIDSNVRMFSCPFCDKSYKDKYTLNKHLKKIHGKQIGLTRAYNRKQASMTSENVSCKIRRVKQSRSLDIHRCKTCGKHFYGAKNFRQHCRKVHGIYVRKNVNLSDHHKPQNMAKLDKNLAQTNHSMINTDFKMTKNNTSIAASRKPIRRCPVCNKLYRDHFAWKNHCKKEHGVTIQFIGSFPTELGYNNFDCKTCNKKFYKAREIIQHYKVAHHQRLRYKCEMCKALFYDIKSLTRHSSNMHKLILLLRRNPKGKVTCEVCGISCVNRSDLDFHKKEEHPNNRSSGKLKIQKLFEQRKLKSTSSRRKQYGKNNINCETTFSNSVSANQLSKNSQSSENTSSDIVYMTNCILCENRKFKHIRKHFMEYHKVRNPEALIAQCSKTPIEPVVSTLNSNNVHDNVEDIKQNTNNTLTNSKSNKSQKTQWRNRRCIGPERFFLRISQPHEKKFYACKYCSFSSNNYDAMRSDEKRHKREGITSETKPLYDHVNSSVTNSSSSFILNRKRKCESIDNRNTRRRKLSPSLNQIRTTRASTKIKEEYYHICSLCGRTFRSTEILKSHKVSCIARLNQQSGSETSDTRASSDRDSGIGISITIKKKNDSYEIVNRDNNDDKFNNQIELNKEQNHSLPENSASLLLATSKNLSERSDESFEYSKHHKFVKIQQAEDSDVDICSDLENQNNVNFNNQENSVNENCSSEINNKKTDVSNNDYQVPSLKILCQKALVKRIEEKNKPIYKCPSCSKVWPSMNSLCAHKKVHMRYRK
ncbi:zinc finger protein 107-like [Chelonus insularis]|uniref:zinc finger protein 107-like n=1 Tax=Chelonus insularis TaxID=460826 RepID=UPI00158DB69E|nr:zinc finger protein 107-like [Chelonus insularis]